LFRDEREGEILNKILSNFFKAIKEHKKDSLLSFLFVVLLSILSIIVPILIKFYLEWIINDDSQLLLIVIGIFGFACLLLIKTFINTFWYLSLDNFGGKYITDLSLECQNALNDTYMSEVEKLSTNVIKHTLYYDILEVFRVVAHHIPSIIGSIIVIILSFTLAFYYNPVVSLLILASLVIGILISFFSRNIISRKASTTNQNLKQVHEVVNEFSSAIPFIQTSLTIDYYNSKVKKSISSFISVAKKEDKVIYLWSGIIQNYSILFSIVLSAFLAYSLDGNALVNFAFFSVLSNIIMSEGQKIELMFHQTVKAKVCFVNIDKILNIRKKIGIRKLSDITSIRFENVTFSYGIETNSFIKNFNLKIEKGDCIRISGLNGSGKSSIIKILLGLYPIKAGNIKINDISINELDLKSLYSKTLFVNQDEFLMNDSIIEYLKANCAGVNDETLKVELEKMRIEEKIMINYGSNLSVGQRKKILYIKAKLKFALSDLIIFDEVTSGMDKETQIDFANFVNEYSMKKDKIIIVIDHNNFGGISFNKEINID
jgi:ABC-type multidrug transport system fused ATPase/permease subunit